MSSRLGKAIEALCAVHRIDQGDDPREMQTVIEHRIGTQSEQDRGRVGEAGGFDRDPAKPPDLAGSAPFEEAAQSARQVFADGAAQTAARQFEHAALDKVDEVMIDCDLADLIDDDSGIGERRRGERAAQQRRLAAAEKAGEHRRRQCLRFGHAR